MKIKLIYEPFPHAILEDVYTEDELKLIWQELDFLTHKDKVKEATEFGAAKDVFSQTIKASNTGFNLDKIYNDRNVSNILTFNQKVFSKEIFDEFYKLSPLVRSIRHINMDVTNIRYYDNNEEYLTHADAVPYTICTYFYKDRNKIEGGDLEFPEFNYKIKTDNNMAVFFTGAIDHAATPAKRLDDWKPFDGYGRYCMNQFLIINSLLD